MRSLVSFFLILISAFIPVISDDATSHYVPPEIIQAYVSKELVKHRVFDVESNQIRDLELNLNETINIAGDITKRDNMIKTVAINTIKKDNNKDTKSQIASIEDIKQQLNALNTDIFTFDVEFKENGVDEVHKNIDKQLKLRQVSNFFFFIACLFFFFFLFCRVYLFYKKKTLS